MASSQSRLALKKEQLAILSKFWMQFTESANAFINLNVAKGYKETSFQLSVLLKTVVDELEERKSLNGAPHADQTYAAVLLNAEFLLISLNPIHNEEEMRYNPFLRHWANVVMRCQAPVLKALGGISDPNIPDEEVSAVPEWWATAQAARLELIKCAFGILDIMDLQFSTPNMLIESATDTVAAPIDIAPVLALLRGEGLPTAAEPLPPAASFPTTAASMGLSMQQNAIRPHSSAAAPVTADRRTVAEQRAQAAAVAAAMAVAGTGVSSASGSASASAAAAAAAETAAQQAAQAVTPGPRASDAEEEAFLAWLASSPGDALAFLVRLPPTLPTLDLATKVLSSATLLPSRGIEPADVAREHLQHALRFVEGLRSSSAGGGGDGEPAAGSGGGGGAGRASAAALGRLRRGGGGGDGGDGDDEGGDEGGGGGAEGQARAVALLVVYLRNLIASGVLPLDRVWLDVQEVCVRYIWLPQVREFRAWLEGSVVGGGGGGGGGAEG